MPYLLPCAACGRHTLSSDATCPHCGQPSGASAAPARVAALALLTASAACTPTLQSDYGIEITDTMDSGDTGDANDLD